jgi:DNA helicase HerA-like ATPase
MPEPLLIAKGEREIHLLPQMANRHGMISGATGTGKTVSLQSLAQKLSQIGVPTFMADVKGDLAGISQPGSAANAKVTERLCQLGLTDFTFAGCPAVFWDVFGEQGHPVRATISDMGPVLLGRLLNLNETQSGVLTLVFKISDDQGLLLLDLKDLRAMLKHVGDNGADYRTQYGNVSAASIGAIQRNLLALEQQGGDEFFGEPALNLDDLLQTDASGHGVVNILVADKLMLSGKIYSTFLLWLLSELFEQLPEIGDQEKPRLAFFFDEAHLLFSDAPKALLERVEQVVRLIRSRGVGVYFISQNPDDVPDAILGQLGNRIQHALRAFTPRDQRAVRVAAQTFRTNPNLDVEKAISELAVGEALVSMLDEVGTPGIVERALICPPQSQIGSITSAERQAIIQQSVVYGQYENIIDRESAYEKLKARRTLPEELPRAPMPMPAALAPEPFTLRSPAAMPGPRPVYGRPRQTMAEAMATSAARAVGGQLGRQIIRGVLGSILGGRR